MHSVKIHSVILAIYSGGIRISQLVWLILYGHKKFCLRFVTQWEAHPHKLSDQRIAGVEYGGGDGGGLESGGEEKERKQE